MPGATLRRLMTSVVGSCTGGHTIHNLRNRTDRGYCDTNAKLCSPCVPPVSARANFNGLLPVHRTSSGCGAQLAAALPPHPNLARGCPSDAEDKMLAWFARRASHGAHLPEMAAARDNNQAGHDAQRHCRRLQRRRLCQEASGTQPSSGPRLGARPRWTMPNARRSSTC